jgi:hypothetical protein
MEGNRKGYTNTSVHVPCACTTRTDKIAYALASNATQRTRAREGGRGGGGGGGEREHSADPDIESGQQLLVTWKPPGKGGSIMQPVLWQLLDSKLKNYTRTDTDLYHCGWTQEKCVWTDSHTPTECETKLDLPGIAQKSKYDIIYTYIYIERERQRWEGGGGEGGGVTAIGAAGWAWKEACTAETTDSAKISVCRCSS